MVWGARVKIPVAEMGLLTVNCCGLVWPDRSPEKLEKMTPLAGAAVTVTGVPGA